MLTDKEIGTIIFALEEYASILETERSYQAKNSVLELIWKLDQQEKENVKDYCDSCGQVEWLCICEGECDKCSSPYDVTSKENRCGDCGNCGNCCTHKGESE